MSAGLERAARAGAPSASEGWHRRSRWWGVGGLVGLVLACACGRPDAPAASPDELKIGVLGPLGDNDMRIAELDPNADYDLPTRWILNLVFDSFVNPSADETAASGAGRSAPRHEAWEGGVASTSILDSIPDPRDGTCSGAFRLPMDVRLSNGTRLVATDWQETTFGSFRKRMASMALDDLVPELTRRGADVVMYRFRTGSGGCFFEARDLVLSMPRVWAIDPRAPGHPIGTGRYRWSGEGQDQVVLERNPAAPPNGEAARILVVRYSGAAAALRDRADLVLTNQGLAALGVSETGRHAERVLPRTFHYFAVLNPRSIPDVEVRLAIVRTLLGPTRDTVVAAGASDGVEPNRRWFPTAWGERHGIESWVSADAATARAEPAVSASRVALDRPLELGLAQGLSEGEEPLVSAIRDRADALGIPRPRVRSVTRNGDWSAFDVVIYRAEMDERTDDPSPLVWTDGTRAFLDAVPGVGTRLRALAHGILVGGLQPSSLARSALEVDSTLKREAIVFPLFSRSLHLVYRVDRLAPPAANRRRGLGALRLVSAGSGHAQP